MPFSRRLRWAGILLGGVAALAMVVGVIGWLVGRAKLTRAYDPPAGLTSVPRDSATLAEGEHLVRIYGCRGCHGENLGGGIVADVPPGRFVASNLTRGRGGVGTMYQIADWDHAIRSGLRPDHTPLIPVMPYRVLGHLGDADAAALIAYVQQVPAVDNSLPSSTVRLPGYLLVAVANRESLFGRHTRPPVEAPAQGTAAYGAYLVATICSDCHGERLQGGQYPEPGSPPGPPLSAAAFWSEADLATALRTGVAPGGRHLSEWMPVWRLQYLTDSEIHSLYLFLPTVRTPH